MKFYVLVYEQFAQFEVVLANLVLSTIGEVVIAGITKEAVKSSEGFTTLPDVVLNEVDIDNTSALIIPGGVPEAILNNRDLSKKLEIMNKKNKIIAAICSAPIHLINAGIVGERKITATIFDDSFEKGNFIDSKLVVDENLITAKGDGFVEFAIALAEKFVKDPTDPQFVSILGFLKSIR